MKRLYGYEGINVSNQYVKKNKQQKTHLHNHTSRNKPINATWTSRFFHGPVMF